MKDIKRNSQAISPDIPLDLGQLQGAYGNHNEEDQHDRQRKDIEEAPDLPRKTVNKEAHRQVRAVFGHQGDTEKAKPGIGITGQFLAPLQRAVENVAHDNLKRNYDYHVDQDDNRPNIHDGIDFFQEGFQWPPLWELERGFAVQNAKTPPRFFYFNYLTVAAIRS
jgi:hypothetical protein